MSNQEEFGVFTPQEVSTLGLEAIREAEQNADRVIPLHIPGIDEYFLNLRPGEICAVQAQTHNFKSGFISAWEAFLAEHLIEQKREDEVIIHVDNETVIEQQAATMYARYTGLSASGIMRGSDVDWNLLKARESDVARLPIFRIGVSLRNKDFGFEDLYLSNVFRAIDYIQTNVLGRELRPAAIFLDYLQAFPYDPTVRRAPIEHQRRLQVREDVYRVRSASARYDCPIIVGLQAKQHLEGAPGQDMLIPGMYDGKETSDIAERFDRIISLWLPKTTHSVGQRLHHGGMTFTCREDLAWLRIVKQRGGARSGAAWPLNVDYNSGGMTIVNRLE